MGYQPYEEHRGNAYDRGRQGHVVSRLEVTHPQVHARVEKGYVEPQALSRLAGRRPHATHPRAAASPYPSSTNLASVISGMVSSLLITSRSTRPSTATAASA